jgi:hypothetical protein
MLLQQAVTARCMAKLGFTWELGICVTRPHVSKCTAMGTSRPPNHNNAPHCWRTPAPCQSPVLMTTP